MTDNSTFRLLTFMSAATASEDSVESRIRSFSRLQAHWDFGRGVPATEQVVKQALHVYSLGRGLGLRADAFAGDDGEVGLKFYNGDQCLSVLIRSDGTRDTRVEDGIGWAFDVRDEATGVALSDVFETLKRFHGVQRWNSLESSIPNTLISTASASRTSPSRIRETREAYRYSNESVLAAY